MVTFIVVPVCPDRLSLIQPGWTPTARHCAREPQLAASLVPPFYAWAG